MPELPDITVYIEALEDDFFLVLHLMIAGRLLWKEASGAGPPRPGGLRL